MKRFGSLLTLVLTTMFLIAGPVLASDDHRTIKYDVTITNLTRGQTFTPILVASHKRGVKLFELGSPASDELAVLAEGGNTGPLTDRLNADPRVMEVTSSGPLPPGASVTVTIKTRGQFRHISGAAMLIPTNDAFFSIQGVRVPFGKSTRVVNSPAYDAGSEFNDEFCEHIPGGGVCAGEGVSPADATDEGYVHIHAGIHGIGNLEADAYDWRNPVARITIQRSK